jgi:hypothetical protein
VFTDVVKVGSALVNDFLHERMHRRLIGDGAVNATSGSDNLFGLLVEKLNAISVE